MDHYLEIRVLPDPEFGQADLMGALFSKLHRALVAHGGNDIGVSFPDEDNNKRRLGGCLRLHGTLESLNQLIAQQWLKGLRDYTEQTSIQLIPSAVKYRAVKRVQPKSSAERLKRRSVAKGWLTQVEADERILPHKEQRLALPFINLRSLSSGQNFPLFIQQGALCDEPSLGLFSTYGLSATATIPWF